MRVFFLVCSVLGLVSAHESNHGDLAPASSRPTARIEQGLLIGTTTSLPLASASVNQFLGVAFAKPPERFAPPAPPPAGHVAVNATVKSPQCIQQPLPPSQTDFFYSIGNGPNPRGASEDCLYLNVYVPSTPAPPSGRAVLFWLFGGGLQQGDASYDLFDGSAFAAYEDVVLVQANYRVSVLGFPNAPEIPIAEQNLGLLDQHRALEWVQANIHAFGGDPNKVTLFGQSAGASSVDNLILSYPEDSPFHGAILQSGQASLSISSGQGSASSWFNLTTNLGCPGNYESNLTCVKAADASTIANIVEVNGLSFRPVADNATLFADPITRRAAGLFAQVPVLGGNNAQEERMGVFGENDLEFYLNETFGTNVSLLNAVRAAYPRGVNNLNTDYDIIAQIASDNMFHCPQAQWANLSASQVPTWRYYYNATFANTEFGNPWGVYHTSEVPEVFSTYPDYLITTQQYALSNYMRGAWARFAKWPRGGPGWNQINTGTSGRVLGFGGSYVEGGLYTDRESNQLAGTFDLGLLGVHGNSLSSGVTVIDRQEVDFNCYLFA